MTHAEIFAVVRRIPKGRVATYGQIAALAGHPGHARQVGYALSALDVDAPVPWHRVVNAQGRVSARSGASGGAMLQQLRLQQEGVVMQGNRVSLQEYGWDAAGAAGQVRSWSRRGSSSRPPGRA